MAPNNSPPSTSFTKLSYPAPYIVLVTLSRPKSLNCIDSAGHAELHEIWNWFDHEPTLRVAVITGEGRAFCAGADLKEWNQASAGGKKRPQGPAGFGGLSTRTGRKPVIAAVNGICFGGGCEMIVNTDIVLASPAATFALPEVKRGVIALAGALPRLVRTVGKQRAMEMALRGRVLKAEEAREWGLVNAVADDVIGEAVKWAAEIADNSPDSVLVTKQGIMAGWENMSAQQATEWIMNGLYKKMDGAENMKEGLQAFVEKRKPKWVDSKL